MATFNTRARPLPTVEIDVDGKKVIINKTNYDEDKHKLWAEKPVVGNVPASDPEESPEPSGLKRRVKKK